MIPDLRESDTMDPLPDSQIDELLGFKPEHLGSGSEASAKAASVRNRNEWTVAALCCCCSSRSAKRPGRGFAGRRGSAKPQPAASPASRRY